MDYMIISAPPNPPDSMESMEFVYLLAKHGLSQRFWGLACDKCGYRWDGHEQIRRLAIGVLDRDTLQVKESLCVRCLIEISKQKV